METFFWLIGGFSIVLIIKYLYDKHLLEDSLKSLGGIKEKYKVLIRYLSNSPNSRITEFKDHLTVSVISPTIKTLFTVTPAFGDILIVEVSMDYGIYGKIENKWSFNTYKYNQEDMVKAIHVYMESALGKFTRSVAISSSVNATTKVNVKGEVSKIEFLSLTERIELAILLYHTILPTSMLKARVLSIWYQPSHNNTFSDFITQVFQDVKRKERMLIPVTINQETNYKVILMSVKKAEGYEKIEELFFRFIRLVKEKHEIDRLLFLILAISPDYKDDDDLLLPIIELAFTDLKLQEDMEEYNRYHIFKTLLDIYSYKGFYDAALNIAEENYNVLNTTEYNLPWLKYQYAKALCNLHNKGYKSRWNDSFLLKQIEEHLSEAVLQDYNFELYMKQAK